MKRPTSPYLFNEQRFAKWTAEGRGTGHRLDYKPWLRITNVPSRGLRSRLKSTTHGRVMHMMSNLERNAVFEFEWRGVLDIREQFPLDREKTRRIAAAMGMRHPRDPSSRVDIVMTTDLVIDGATPEGSRVMPYAVKTVQDLAKPSVQRKFELERRYWESLGMRLGLLTDRQLRGSRFENIRWLRDWHWTENVNGYDAARWRRTAELAMHIVSSMQGRSVGEVCAAIAAAEGVTAGTAFSVLRHLGARKRLLVDVDLPRPLLRDPIERFALPTSAAAAGTAA
ncbi:TnsA endonuclease N-terminal domain-containing protein [Sphingomonas olei]|uniref:Heteromeric transposase endonuclease subunit TnsA n=1 Tax=Sphingomonas olei TaxID=1886787 RepID=A0ABY2QJR2_9SPHN|nr:TnsA endonuclease N-terminal domain-containing protein [Sphingomonas olei]THG40693.1 hypothetical protein E5988_07760 [Sphingomonas olei]